jgi:hypothetical protein
VFGDRRNLCSDDRYESIRLGCGGFCFCSHFSSTTVTEAQWLASGRNFMRMQAKAVESYGMSFHLTEVTEQGAYLKASYEVTNARLGKQESGYWLIGEGPFITQVVEKQQVRSAGFKEVTTDRVL